MDIEIVTLSSDEDMESTKSSNPVTKTPALTTESTACSEESQKRGTSELQEVQAGVKNIEPVGITEKSDKGNSNVTESGDEVEKHSKTNGVDGEKNPTCKNKNNLDDKITIVEIPNDENSNPSGALGESETVVTTSEIPQESDDMKNQTVNESSSILSELMEFCTFLRQNPSCIEKVLKNFISFAADDSDPVLSREFRIFIKKLRNISRKKNVHFMAKSISELLKMDRKGEKQKKVDDKTINERSNIKCQQRRLYKIQKIIKKLNQMGYVIRDLEKQEVDLNDEENSAYLKLQRFRQRFWLVYRKLCEFTKDLNINRIFNDRINFTETDRPEVNERIEKWLNETKTFPDFADVLKILERERNELKLPEDETAFRALAVEIFQKVGNLLQTKRKYDLWNSLCGFLENTEDPAMRQPDLEDVFKKSYQSRLQKEGEIYDQYAERQNAELLQPALVSDEDAYLSPESGLEDEEEIFECEDRLARRLTVEFEINNTDDEKSTSDYPTDESDGASSSEKGSKNNFQNCKSLRRRPEKEGTSRSQDSLLREAGAGAPNTKHLESKFNSVNPDSEKDILEPTVQPIDSYPSTQKRAHPLEPKKSILKKRRSLEDEINSGVNLKKGGKTPVYDIGHCRIVTNYNFKERRKVFRDLTNVRGLMKKAGLRDKMTGCHAPLFLYSRYLPRKEISWKERFKINVRKTKPKNQKCGLSEEEKTSEKSRDSDDKESKNNGENGQEGADFSSQGNEQGEEFSAQGNGQEEDNNDKGDENRRNGKVDDENEDHEEDDDEEKEDENADGGEHSSDIQKTERENEDSSEPAAETSVKTNETGTENDVIVENNEEEEIDQRDECEYFEDECGRDAGNKAKDSEDVEEFENLKSSLEPICVLKEEDTCDVIDKANNEVLVDVHQKSKNTRKLGRKSREEKFKTGPFIRNRLRAGTAEGSKSEGQRRLPMTGWTLPPETSQPKPRKMSASDEERVKRFLMHSPSSISITPPRKLTLSKPPSQSALQALATLRNLKGISATIVKGKPKTEDSVSMTGSQSKRQSDQSCPIPAKKRMTNLPVISSVQSVNTLTPKIVTVQGNVSGFENLWPEMKNHGNSSSIRISKVWGSSQGTVTQGNPSNYPGCSSRKSNPSTSTPTQVRKKNPKKPVEYVVLD